MQTAYPVCEFIRYSRFDCQPIPADHVVAAVNWEDSTECFIVPVVDVESGEMMTRFAFNYDCGGPIRVQILLPQ